MPIGSETLPKSTSKSTCRVVVAAPVAVAVIVAVLLLLLSGLATPKLFAFELYEDSHFSMPSKASERDVLIVFKFAYMLAHMPTAPFANPSSLVRCLAVAWTPWMMMMIWLVTWRCAVKTSVPSRLPHALFLRPWAKVLMEASQGAEESQRPCSTSS